MTVKQMEWDFIKDVPKAERKARIQHPVDAVLTLSFSEHTLHLAFTALECGLQLGIQSAVIRMPGSKRNALADLPWYQKLPFTFVDNEWHDYDHQVHLDAVAELKPKYATVRDYLTPEQARIAGIAYYSLDQILKWAEELEQHAEHVIVIPKADVLHEIPERHVLGYSVPSRYGGTPLPIETFTGRSIHLLGGSWAAQRALMDQMGDDIVSVDFNYLYLVARYGQVVMPDGAHKELGEVFGGARVINPISAASILSLGFISAALVEEYAPLSGNTTDRTRILRSQFIPDDVQYLKEES